MRYHKRIVVLLLIGASIFLGFLLLFASNVSRDLESHSLVDEQSRHRLCVLVPFRDRWRELLVFISHMSSFLENQGITFRFIVVHQTDSWRFNRASLINAGFLEAPKNCDYFAIHDVDLIPLNAGLIYRYPKEGPMHLTPPGLHPKYDYPSFFGGILIISREDYLRVNGMSNNYWGWGLEDDEFRARVVEAGLIPQKPSSILTGKSDTFEHIHFRSERTSRDMESCFNQKDITHYRDRLGGLSTAKYTVAMRREMSVDGFEYTLMDVDLRCDKSRTPWCSCKGSNGPQNQKKFKVDEARRKDLILPRLSRSKSRSR